MVYIWNKNGTPVWHTDLEAAKRMDGIDGAPDKTVSNADFEAANNLVRVIDGVIVVGKTDAEKAAEAKVAADSARLAWLRGKLAETDYVVIKIAEGAATADDYKDEIAQRQAWRKEADDLVKAGVK